MTRVKLADLELEIDNLNRLTDKPLRYYVDYMQPGDYRYCYRLAAITERGGHIDITERMTKAKLLAYVQEEIQKNIDRTKKGD